MNETYLLAAGEGNGVLAFLGKFGVAGFGIALLFIFYKMAKNSALLYDSKRVKPWYDIMSMAVGIMAMSSLANLTGSMWAIPANLLGSLINTIFQNDIAADLGPGAITLMLAFGLYLKKGIEQHTYILHGCWMAILFPIAGGVWAMASTALANVGQSIVA